MNIRTLHPTTTASRVGLAALGIAIAWFVVHVVIYVLKSYRFGSGWNPVLFGQLEFALKHFIGWQMLGFFLLAIIAQARRSAILGQLLGGYLIASAIVLLAFSQDPAMVGKLTVLLLWNVCTVVGIRQAIAWAVGDRYATWGVAAASLYAALVPVCFFLGVLHAITPSNVSFLAVVSALPGAVVGIKFLLKRNAGKIDGSGPLFGEKWSLLAWCLIEVIGIVLAIEFMSASTPEVRSDAVRVYLPYIHRVIAEHGISHQYACWHRLQPMAVQTYSATIAAVGTITAAKLFSWLALGSLVLLIVEEVRLRSGSFETGLFAGAAVLYCPEIAGLARTLYVDLTLTLLCTAAFIVLFRALRPPCFRGILFSAAIIASMVPVKYTGLMFAVVWGLFLVIDLWRQRGWQVALAWSTAAGALAAIMAFPWFFYVYLGTGNPFYPYLHRLFPSPYWADGFSLQKDVLGTRFKMPPGVAGMVSFPWVATYQTRSISAGQDGFIGFWGLALAPCWILTWRRGGIQYWDMVIVGIMMIVGIVSYTPFTRYSLPAYPLLVTSCVLAAGSLLQSISWRPTGRWATSFTAIAMTLLLLLPMPLLCIDMPWNIYAKSISTEKYFAQRFSGYQATQQLNAIVKPDEGVICSISDGGVYLLGGRPYEYAPWWNKIHHISDSKSFTDFCKRYDIHYWIVDHGNPIGQVHESVVADIAAEFWTEARLVTADGTVAVYDVTLPSGKGNKKSSTSREWATVLELPTKPWKYSDPYDNWIQITADPVKYEGEGVVNINGRTSLAHRIEPECPGMYRVNLGLFSDKPSTVALIIKWYDAKGNLLAQTNGSYYGGCNYETQIYSTAPSKAAIGWINVQGLRQTPVQLKYGSVKFWESNDAAPMAQRSLPSDNVKGVQ
jgi:hypothetical protein